VPAALVVDGADHDAGPEPRAVLADAPPLLLVAAGREGDLELVRRVVALDVRVGVEDREVPPEDLLLGVALDPLGALVPGDDPAVRVEHEDRVVARARHEQLELTVLAVALSRRRHGHQP
jgi:hypothetical protein